jgi:hypothetical protein
MIEFGIGIFSGIVILLFLFVVWGYGYETGKKETK